MLGRIFALLDSPFITRIGNLRTIFSIAILGVIVVIAAFLLLGRWLVPLLCLAVWLGVMTLVFVSWRRDRASTIAGESVQQSPSKTSRWYARSAGSSWPVGIERAIAECAIAVEDLQRERHVRGDTWFAGVLPDWISDTDDLLACADAGDLLAAFRADEVRPSHTVEEQIAYLSRQERLFRDALARLRG